MPASRPHSQGEFPFAIDLGCLKAAFAIDLGLVYYG